MKRICLTIAVLLSVCTAICAQDTITFVNGDEVIARVREVSDTELKYNLWNNQDGPIYVKKTADIYMIKYKNGHKEEYAINAENINNSTISNNQGWLQRSSGRLVLNGKKLSEEELKGLLTQKAYSDYVSARSKKAAGDFCLFTGTVCVGTAIAIMSTANGYDETYYAGLVVALLADILYPIGLIKNGIAKGRISRIADDYNAAHGYRDNFSVRFSPSLLRTTTAQGSSTFGVGAGLTLNF